MEMFYYRGLNCHLASLVNIAHLLGVKYTDAFANLWSETEFINEAEYDLHVSGRVPVNLKALGVMTERLEGGPSALPDGAFLLVGMDTFHIPWHPVFLHFHDPHFFYAQKQTADAVLCYDPIYGETGYPATSDDFLPSAFEVCHVYKAGACQPKVDLLNEARAVVRCHPETARKLLTQIQSLKGEGKGQFAPLIKQLSAMINNRYLLQRYLAGTPYPLDDALLCKWEAVKNGLYKAYIMEDNIRIVDEVCARLLDVMQEETAMAEVIITGYMV